MKKIWNLMLLAMLTQTTSLGQNLIGNAGFEDTVSCPDNLGQIDRAANWFITRSTPDYFNSCAPSIGTTHPVSVPLNFWGFQNSVSGNAYIGFAAKSGPLDIREYVGTSLINPLQVGVKYFASFRINLANISYAEICGCNKIGLLFSTVQYSAGNPAPICNCSQVYTNVIVTDTLNWVTLSGSFIADSNYGYVNVGNFFDDLNTDSNYISGFGWCTSYYYFDDLCVSTDSAYCSNYVYSGINSLDIEDQINIYPNPADDFITLTASNRKIKSVTLYNGLGEMVKQYEFNAIGSTKINTNDLEPTFYLLKVFLTNGNLINKLFIKQLKK